MYIDINITTTNCHYTVFYAMNPIFRWPTIKCLYVLKLKIHES